MKLNANRARFRTLNRRHAAGFTLVELIAVVAITAILAGVAIPAYSGYITRANKQADISLIADIRRALTLAGYNGTFAEGESGGIVLSDGTVRAFAAGTDASGNAVTVFAPIAAGSGLDKALTAAFGSGYAGTLKLKYKNWTTDGMYAALTPETAFVIANSSFMSGGRTGNLLPDVEKITGMATNLVLGMTGGNAGITFSGLFSVSSDEGGSVCMIDEVARDYGITPPADGNWEAWAADRPNAFGNLLVMTAAREAGSQLAGGKVSLAGTMIRQFSSYYAYAAVDPAFSAQMDAAMEDLSGVTDVTTGQKWFSDLTAAANKDGGFDAYMAGDRAGIDAGAFVSILAGLDSTSPAQKKDIGADLGNANLFTTGAVNDLYSEYLSMVEAMNGMFEAGMTDLPLGAGEVAVFFSQKAAHAAVGDTLPG